MRYDEDMSNEIDDGVGYPEDALNALRDIEAGIVKSIDDVCDLISEAKNHILVIETSLMALERERATMRSVLDVTEAARVAMEELLAPEEDGFRDWPTESKAPEVPSNVTPIREEKATAKSGIGAAVKQAKARKPRAPKPPKPPTERDKLKATHVSGVLGFDGAEKPDFL